ncbi:hypothetical protein BOVA115_4749 [Bacteroides ovatus]|nr:hypothetical protein BOVA115_4749 [Bacteroides ovatus]
MRPKFIGIFSAISHYIPSKSNIAKRKYLSNNQTNIRK